MQSMVYETVERSSSIYLFVRPSVCHIIHQQRQHAAGSLLSVVQAGDIDRQGGHRTPSRNGAAAQHSVANVGSVI